MDELFNDIGSGNVKGMLKSINHLYKDKYLGTLLHQAAFSGNESAVDALLESGSDVKDSANFYD